MIPFTDIDKPHNYAYVAGCRNVAWLVGRIQSIEGSAETGYALTFTRTSEERAFKVHLEKGDRIPEDLAEGKLAKAICHLYSGRKSEDDEDMKAGRHLRLVAKYLGHPTILDVRSGEDFTDTNVTTDTALCSDIELSRQTLTDASNRVEIAGVVDGAPVMVRDNDNEKSRLVFMLRQAQSPQHVLPVEIAGKHALAYRKAVSVGQPVAAFGMILASLRSDTGEVVPVLSSNHVRLAVPDRDFKFDTLPDWALDIRRRWRAQVERERQRLAALEAARMAEAEVMAAS